MTWDLDAWLLFQLKQDTAFNQPRTTQEELARCLELRNTEHEWLSEVLTIKNLNTSEGVLWNKKRHIPDEFQGEKPLLVIFNLMSGEEK